MTIRSVLRTRVPVLPAAYRSIRYSSMQGPIWRDLLSTHNIARQLFPAIATRDGPVVLVVTSSDMIYETKLLMCVAAELRQRGLRAIAIFGSRDPIHLPLYARAFGIRDHIYLDRFKGGRITKPGPLGMIPDSVPALRKFTFGDVDIGVHALSTLSRRHHVGSLDFSDGRHRAELASELKQLADFAKTSQALIRMYRPRHLICMESKGAATGPLIDTALAEGTDVVQLTQPWRDDALMCKRITQASRRIHPSSIDRQTLFRFSKAGWGEQQEELLSEEFRARYTGKWNIQSRNQPANLQGDLRQVQRLIGFNDAKRLVVVFSHVLWDANLFYGEDLFDDYGEWFTETIAAAVGNDSVNWILKLHPASAWKLARERLKGDEGELQLIRKVIDPLPPHIRLLGAGTSVSTLALYEIADYGVTVRGTAGMEMPCFGKPVLTAGTGRYSHLGFTIDSSSRDEYLHRLGTIGSIPPLDEQQTRLAKLHALTVFSRRPWLMKSIHPSIQDPGWGAMPLDHNFDFLVRSRSELEENGDLASLSHWIANNNDLDYINDLH